VGIACTMHGEMKNIFPTLIGKLLRKYEIARKCGIYKNYKQKICLKLNTQWMLSTVKQRS
jgi:hypothetical protein